MLAFVVALAYLSAGGQPCARIIDPPDGETITMNVEGARERLFRTVA